MPRPIFEMTIKEREELENEVCNVVTDFINSEGNEDFPFREKIEEIRVKRDIDDFEMSLFMSAYLSQVIEFLENRGLIK
jgi:hypothetical protein